MNDDGRFSNLFGDENMDEYEDECENCDMYEVGYKHGYKDGMEDGYEEGVEECMREEDFEFPSEIEISAEDLNTIECIKDELREAIFALCGDIPSYKIQPLWDVIKQLNLLEKSMAGNQVLDYYLINRPFNGFSE